MKLTGGLPVGFWAGFSKDSKGQRARGGASSGSVSPSASRSIPAQAIIAPLSVHKNGGGRVSENPRAAQSPSSVVRIAPLEATPPAATMSMSPTSMIPIASWP